MTPCRSMALSALALAASVSASYAGPCAAQIDQMQARIDAKEAAIAAAGPFLRQGAFAGRSDQPTSRSIAAAEVKAGELSPQTFRVVSLGMERARAADAAGDSRTCRKALGVVRHALGR